MNPKLWGPLAWTIIHEIALGYPDNPTNEQMIIYKRFFLNLGKLIPCEACKNNFMSHLIKHPLDKNSLGSKKRLVEWSINVHNEVNRLTDKKKITYADFMRQISLNKKKVDETIMANNFDNQLWFVLKYFLFNYPTIPSQEDRLTLKNFLLDLKEVIPYQNSRDRYKEVLTKYPVENIVNMKREVLIWFKKTEQEILSKH